jgi:hypothetical protein
MSRGIGAFSSLRWRARKRGNDRTASRKKPRGSWPGRAPLLPRTLPSRPGASPGVGWGDGDGVLGFLPIWFLPAATANAAGRWRRDWAREPPLCRPRRGPCPAGLSTWAGLHADMYASSHRHGHLHCVDQPWLGPLAARYLQLAEQPRGNDPSADSSGFTREFVDRSAVPADGK